MLLLHDRRIEINIEWKEKYEKYSLKMDSIIRYWRIHKNNPNIPSHVYNYFFYEKYNLKDKKKSFNYLIQNMLYKDYLDPDEYFIENGYKILKTDIDRKIFKLMILVEDYKNKEKERLREERRIEDERREIKRKRIDFKLQMSRERLRMSQIQ